MKTEQRGGALAVDDPRLAERVRAVFDQGRLLALPTETVYGLAAPIDRPDLVARVFELKGRPADNPLIVHVGTWEQARRVVSAWPEPAESLSRAFWPGPLTLVLPRAACVSDAITAGLDSVAVRMPDHPAALAVLRALDVPLVAPSANLFTRLSPTCAADVRAVFSAEQVEVIDGGPCRVGIESTIVGVDDQRRVLLWLRPGMLARAEVARHLPEGWRLAAAPAGADESDPRLAPGRMQTHYRPTRPLHVHVCRDRAECERLADRFQRDAARSLVVLPQSVEQAAGDLYRLLRAADTEGSQTIDLLLPSQRLHDPAWEGVINRLRKAASLWFQNTDRSKSD